MIGLDRSSSSSSVQRRSVEAREYCLEDNAESRCFDSRQRVTIVDDVVAEHHRAGCVAHGVTDTYATHEELGNQMLYVTEVHDDAAILLRAEDERDVQAWIDDRLGQDHVGIVRS